MVAKPAFVIEISKGGNLTLAIHCIFPDVDLNEANQAGEEAEQYGMLFA